MRSASPNNWPSSSYELKSNGDISQESEAYRKWKEGDKSSATSDTTPLYETSGVVVSNPQHFFRIGEEKQSSE